MAELVLPTYDVALDAVRPKQRWETDSGFERIHRSPAAAELAEALSQVGYRLGNMAVSEVVETETREKLSYWVAFQANLSQDELRALPADVYSRPRKNGDTWEVRCDRRASGVGYVTYPYSAPGMMTANTYRQKLADRYCQLGEKIIDQGQGSIWLPKHGVEASIPDPEALPTSLSPDAIHKYGGIRPSLRYDCWVGHNVVTGYYSSMADSSIFIELDLHDDYGEENETAFTMTKASINLPELVKYLIDYAPDQRQLWFDDGLHMVVEDMASAAYRAHHLKDETAARDLFVLAGRSLSLLYAHREKAYGRSKEQEAIQQAMLTMQRIAQPITSPDFAVIP